MAVNGSPSRVFGLVGLLVMVVAPAFAERALGGVAGRLHPPVRVSAGELLVGTDSGRLLVLDRRGRRLRRVPGRVNRYGPQGVALAPDRRHAFVAVVGNDRPPRLSEVDLATGARRRIAAGISPAVSPDGARLAYVSTRLRVDVVERTALVVRDLRTRRDRKIALPPRVPLGTPPELVIDWSPDGRRIALFDGTRIRLVRVARAHKVRSQPPVPGDPEPARGRTPSLAPVFLRDGTLVVLADCCIGRQHLVAVDLRSGARTPFATLPAPVESIHRLEPGRLLAVTALGKLTLVSRNHPRTLTTGVTAATG